MSFIGSKSKCHEVNGRACSARVADLGSRGRLFKKTQNAAFRALSALWSALVAMSVGLGLCGGSAVPEPGRHICSVKLGSLQSQMHKLTGKDDSTKYKASRLSRPQGRENDYPCVKRSV